jgi:hypothetical protein
MPRPFLEGRRAAKFREFQFRPKRRMIRVHAGAPAEKFAGNDDPAPHRRRPSLFPGS